MSKRLSLFLIFISTIIVLIIAFKQSTTYTKPTPIVQSLTQDYNWQAFNTTTWQLDKTPLNQKQDIIFTKSIHYQNKNEVSSFIQPHFIQITDNDQLYILDSKRGETIDKNTISLEGQVQLHHFFVKNPEQNKTLKTEQISYNTETELLSSPDETEISQPHLTIKGKGFEANLTTGEYHFFSGVKTIYIPK